MGRKNGENGDAGVRSKVAVLCVGFAVDRQSFDSRKTNEQDGTSVRPEWNKKKEKMHSFLLGWSHSSFGVVSQFDKLVSPIALG